MVTMTTTAASSSADILIVDDTPDNIRFLSAMLLDQGYNVRKAINGPMALIAAQTLPPDLILLDVNMPEMSGYEVCQRLKSIPQTESIPVIFLSALDDVVDKVKAFEVGAVDYVTKPFQFAEVLARIQTQLTIQNLQHQLQNQNAKLQTTLRDLKIAQAQLIQKEKMVGLGQLVAGVAHEINNPISFISGNLSHAQRYIEDLLNLVSLYQQNYPEPTPEIEAAIEDLDLDFLTSDLKKLLGSMHTGVDRICTILLALRIFSRLDESDVKLVDIHEGIDSSLVFLRHRLLQKNGLEINVVKEYGDLPLIACYASQLNQVFLNLLTNAVDALTGGYEPSEIKSSLSHEIAPSIWIRTELINPETVKISIKDNGLGIPEALRSRIFEPFFTTKPIGQGSGLGLSTSYQIVVEKHRGKLICNSIPGEGSEFVIELPVQELNVT